MIPSGDRLTGRRNEPVYFDLASSSKNNEEKQERSRRLLKSPLGRKACFTPRCGFQHKLFRTASCIRESFENSARALDGQFE